MQVLGAGVPPTWSLADLATSYSDQGGATTTYAVEVLFHTDATVDVFRDISADLLNEQNPYVNPAAQAANTWVRCTFVSGNDMTAGAARGVWHRLDTVRTFTMRHTSAGGEDKLTGVFDFELSSAASGSPIEAQKLAVTIIAGEAF
jgi:hypothetical protein